MFWRFGGYSNISTIDTLLDKQTTTLEDLLEEQDVVQELKSHHTKLIEFLRDDDHLHALLKYVIAPGPEVKVDDDFLEDEEGLKIDEEQDKIEKKRLKYAFVASEILACETWSITEALMSNTQYMTEFWEFLRRPAPLDPLQAGYFTKVNETLLDKKLEEMLDFIKSLPDIVPAILKHVDCPMIMDLLLKIISLDKSEGGAGITDWIHDQGLVPTLLSSLSPDCNSTIQTAAGDFLKAIITVSANAAQNEQQCIGPNSLTRQLVSESCIQQLISYMLKGGNPLTVGVGIIIEVIRKNNSDYDPENGQNPDAPPTSHDPIYLGTLLRLFAKHVPDFMQLILSSQHTVTDNRGTRMVERGVLKSAWGTSIEPLGFDRFKTCELMAELLHCSNMALLNERGSEEAIKVRDEERERLRRAGTFSRQKSGDDSTIDVSVTSSKFENSLVPSADASTEELKLTTPEEDGFEKVSVDVPEPAGLKAPATLTSKLVASDDNQLSFGKAKSSSAHDVQSPTSGLSENVHRFSLEDTEMTSPSIEPTDIPNSPIGSKSGDISPHPEDKPAPLFSKQHDPNKTPTSTSPKPSKTHLEVPSSAGIGEANNTQSIDEALQSNEQPVVGDYLKVMFVENQVVPTILSFFFRFPWNNFLHNVVYDVVQQVFNGPMEAGYNKHLAFNLFETGRITEQIIEGQQRSDEAEKSKRMRLGYMGHLTLVAEEVVKFGERHPRENLSSVVQEYIYGKLWEEYVTKTLAETRERDNAILGGFRPENGLGPRQAVLNAVNAGSSFSGSNVLAQAGLGGSQQGLDSVDLSNNGSATSAGYNSGSSLLSGFGSSSDDEDEDMEDDQEDESRRTITQLSTADTGPPADSDQPVPLLPPPPAPLNIAPSKARRRLADRLASRQQQLQEQEAAASEFGMEDDPFAALGDADDQDSEDPFSLDEEEQDITSFGKRNNAAAAKTETEGNSNYSISRGINSLFSSGFTRHGAPDSFEGSLDDSSSEGSGSDGDQDHSALEARTSIERRPLDVDDDDDDEEMGEMVAPTDEANSSDEEVLSPMERERLGLSPKREEDEPVSEFDGQADEDHEDDVVEIPPVSSKHKRRSRGSLG